jgi:hypothetical protein
MEILFNEIIAKKILNLGKEIDIRVQEELQIYMTRKGPPHVIL